MPTDDSPPDPAPDEPTVAPPLTSEIVADEVADMAVDDPERAARFVAAVTHPSPSTTPPTAPSTAGTAATVPGLPASAQRALPAAIVGVLLLQGVVKGRIKRLGLALAGSALVAAFVAGREQRGSPS